MMKPPKCWRSRNVLLVPPPPLYLAPMYCLRKGCRRHRTVKTAPYCVEHLSEQIEEAASRPAFFERKRGGEALCYVCFRYQKFSFGLYHRHADDEGTYCVASGQEIAHLRAS
jgi:hypothetical protein